MNLSVPFSLVSFLLLFSLFQSQAIAANPSWSQRPSWAAEDPAENPGPPRRTRMPTFGFRNNISPFSPGSNNIALDVGQVFLMGDLGDQYADSIGSRLHYTYGVSDMFGFDASLGYSNHSDGKYSMTTLLTGLRTNLSWYDRVIPHIVFGLGFYKPSIEVTDTSSVSPVVFGIHLGPGVDLQLTNQLFFGAALTFHDLFGTTKNTVKGPVDVGGTFTSFFLHAGVSF